MTYHSHKLNRTLRRLRALLQPIFYPVHTPLHRLLFLAKLYSWVPDSEGLDGFRVTASFVVYGDHVEDAVVTEAMHSKTNANGHGCGSDGGVEGICDSPGWWTCGGNRIT